MMVAISFVVCYSNHQLAPHFATMNIDLLPDNCLVAILTRIPIAQLLATVPLVSRRWAHTIQPLTCQHIHSLTIAIEFQWIQFVLGFSVILKLALFLLVLRMRMDNEWNFSCCWSSQSNDDERPPGAEENQANQSPFSCSAKYLLMSQRYFTSIRWTLAALIPMVLALMMVFAVLHIKHASQMEIQVANASLHVRLFYYSFV